MIHQFAACDRLNYGDLMYPVVFKSMMQARGYTGNIEIYGLLPGIALGEAGYNVKSIQEILANKSTEYKTLVVGGGDVLQENTPIVSHYAQIYKEKLKKKAMHKLRSTFFGEPNFIKEFTERYIDYNAIGPYLIDKRKFPNVKSLVYCSCGVPYFFQENCKEKVREAVESASFIYLRDNYSAEKIMQTGAQCEIHTAPDLVIKISDFFDLETESQRGRSILRKRGVDVEKKIMCFQGNANFWRGSENEIVRQLKLYQESYQSEIILLPIGYCHDDDKSLKVLANKSEGAFKYIGESSIYNTLSVIAACDVFVGTSLHGNITAFSFGKRHIFGCVDIEKAKGFLEIVGLNDEYKLKSWSDIVDKLEIVESIDAKFYEDRVKLAKEKVDDVFDAMYKTMLL